MQKYIIMKKIQQILLKLDFLGRAQGFTIASKNNYQTYFGSFISMGLVCTFIYFVLVFGIDMIKHSKPYLVMTTYQEINNDKLALTRENFVFSIGLQNPSTSYSTLYINESIYTLTLYAETNIRTKEGVNEATLKQMPMIRCSEFHFNLVEDYFKLLELDNLYCLNITEDLYLQGEFGQESWKYLNFQFSKCVNSSANNNTCKSQEEIDKRLDGGYIGVFMNDLAVHPNDYQTPFHSYGKNLFSTFNAREYADIWLYLKRVQVNTDQGLVFDSVYKQNSFATDSMVVHTDYREMGSTFLCFKK